METLIDSIIVDCNNAVKAIMNGQYILFCRTMYEMAQKLVAVKQGLAAAEKKPPVADPDAEGADGE